MEAREAWFEGQLDLDPERVVFLDETAAATNMERRFGRAPRGERCRIAVPHGHYKTTTVTAALRASGPFAVSLMDGATTGARFKTYVTHTLVPALRPGDTVVMDNLACTKWPVCERRSKRLARACSISRPTVPTSTQLKWLSPNSRRCCAPPPPGQFRICGWPFGRPSPASHQRSVATTSLPQATTLMIQPERQ